MRRAFAGLFALLLAVSLSAQSGKVYRIRKVGEYPNFMALSPDGRTAYVTSFGTGELLVVDLAPQVGLERVVVVDAEPAVHVDPRAHGVDEHAVHVERGQLAHGRPWREGLLNASTMGQST
jgi:sugar lactone lactonase YvrE